MQSFFRRTDRYGGNFENRYRFLDEVFKAVLPVWPAGGVGVHLSPNGIYNDMGSPEFRETFLHVARQLNIYEHAYLHVVDGLAFGFYGRGPLIRLATRLSKVQAVLLELRFPSAATQGLLDDWAVG